MPTIPATETPSDLIHEVLRAKQLSVTALGKAVGLDRTNLWKVTKGERALTLDSAARIAAYLSNGDNNLYEGWCHRFEKAICAERRPTLKSIG